jgi:cytochrome b561
MQSDVARPGVIGAETMEASYGVAHKTFHWVVFGLIAAQYVVGSVMPHIGKNTENITWVHWHLIIGAAIMFFIFWRLVWRLMHPVPMMSDLPPWQIRTANFAHVGLYTMIFAMSVLGWAAANYRGWTVWLFGIVPLPDLAPKGTPWAHTAGDIHDWLLYVLAAVILAHIGAALYHYFVRHDRVLQRMLPHS